MPVIGLLYLGQYRESLIEAEIETLGVQAEVLAAAVAESSATASTEGSIALVVPGPAAAMVRRMAEVTGARARLFDLRGVAVADSWLLLAPIGPVQREELPPPPGGSGPVAWALRLFDRLIEILPGPALNQPLYREGPGATAADYEEVQYALAGGGGWAVRAAPGGGTVLSAAAPVQFYKQVLGAVLVSRGSQRIDSAVFEVRGAILSLFLVALAFTVAMSLFLAQTIARPLARLAAAAERIRSGVRPGQRLPDFDRRNDEIADLARSLRAMTEVLMRRLEANERFAADVAHELKNPLTSVRSAAETAARIQDPERRRQLLQIVLDDVARLDRLIGDISDASRLDAEMTRGAFAPVPIRPLLETLTATHAAARAEGPPGITLTADPDDLLMVEGFEDRLVQVFRNLVANAASFSPPDKPIRINAFAKDRRVVVQVDDAGPGIPPGKQEAIFERFYSERPATEVFGTHSGLGLSISRQIVEAHGGTITAENLYDREAVAGCRFEIRLPAAETGARGHESAAPRRARPGG